MRHSAGWKRVVLAGLTATTPPALAVSSDELFDLSLQQLMDVRIRDLSTQAEKITAQSMDVPFSLSILQPVTPFDPLLKSLQGIDQSVAALVTTHYNQVTPQLFIRGIGSNAAGSGDDPSTGYLVDGTSIARPGYHSVPLFDLAQAEVMKGPQGTLYGKGLIGGGVNIVTRAPDAGNYSHAHASAGSDGFAAQGIDNRPLGAQATNRLSLSWADRDGYVDNTQTHDTTGGQTHQAVREQIAWNGGDRRLRWLLESADEDSADPAYVYRGDSPLALLGGSALVPHANRSGQVAMPVDGNSQRRHTFSYLQWEQDTRSGRWTSITALHQGHYDYDLYFMPITTGSAANNARENSRQISQEIRFSHSDSRWQWHSGLYLARETTQRDETYDLRELMRLLGLGGSLTADTPGSTDYDSRADTTDAALFGSLRRRLASDWNLTAGARLDNVRKTLALTVRGGDPLNLSLDDSADFAIDSDERWTEPSWSLALDHHLSPHLMLYGRVNTGFKPGNLNSVATSPASALASSKPEQALNRELGLKGFLLDQRLQLNLALFDLDYRDLQVFSQEESESNAPSASIRGLDWDLRARLGEGLELFINHQWLQTGFDEFSLPTGENLAGNHLVRAPRHAMVAALKHSWLDDQGHRWWTQLAWNYTSRHYVTPENTPGSEIPGHAVADAALHWQPDRSGPTYSAWIHNLTNETYPLHAVDQSTFGYTPFGAAWNLAPPRTAGVGFTLPLR